MGKFLGVEVSEYGEKEGYVDWNCLTKLVGDMILNNTIYENTDFEDWIDVLNTDLYSENKAEEKPEFCQYFIISDYGEKLLERLVSDYNLEKIFVKYNSKLDIFLWCIPELGTSWERVLTNIEI